MIKVSVVMITYGQEKYLRQAIEGVLMQIVDFPVELIIANDKSPDNTDSIIKDIIKNHPLGSSVVYLDQEKNVGMISNFFSALKLVRGEYIAFCEGDDYWTDPLKIQKQVSFLEANIEAGIIHSRYEILNEKANSLTTHNFQPNNPDLSAFENYLATADMRTMTVMIRAVFLPDILKLLSQPFMKNAPIGDRPIFLMIGSKSDIGYMDEVTGVYRIVDGDSASHFSSLIKYYNFLLAVSILNSSLFDYLNIQSRILIKKRYKTITFYKCILNLLNNKISLFLFYFVRKTFLHGWTRKEIYEFLGIIKSRYILKRHRG